MRADCHVHMVLDGIDWKASIGRGVDDAFIRRVLETYQTLGYTYLRDGGDRFFVSARARTLAADYGITYRTPLAPLAKEGHYGNFIGLCWQDLSHYARLIEQQKAQGCDFVKIMISGLMDFHQYGILSEESLSSSEIRELIHIAHDKGLSVMAHCNGPDAAIAAAEAGVDSLEHGAYLNEEALDAMAATGVVWVPTVSTVGNLLRKGRFPDLQVGKILDSFLENIASYKGLLAPGSDAGAWAVPHGCESEVTWLAEAGIDTARLMAGVNTIKEKF